jgi:hypothetical protein
MNITLKRNHGYELIFEADNIRVVEDIEERTYEKDENGKLIINLNPKRDIKTDAIEQFVTVLDDMFYYRKAEFDSSDLIENLFEKLPSDKVQSLLTKLHNAYAE